MKKRWISLLLVFAMVAAMVPKVVTEVRAATSGTCGWNVTWVLDDDGTLTIRPEGTGTGYRMYDYYGHDAPWYDVRNSIHSVQIISGIVHIGNNAFEYCPNLTNIEIPDSVLTIGKYSFRNCASLASIAIPESVTSIRDCAFWGCSSLNNVTVPASVTTLGKNSFGGCDSLMEISVADGNPSYINDDFGVLFTKDQSQLLQAPGGLTGEYSVPSSVRNICENAFFQCSALTSISIPDSVAAIESQTFYGCSGLTSITIPEGVTLIGNRSFYGCSSLVSITIPESVTSIGDGAFSYCSSLASITIPEDVTSIGDDTFYYCSSLASITIPEGVTSIGDSAFSYCSSLTHIMIPESATHIGDSAFSYCYNLTNVTFHARVTYIDFHTFYQCKSLTNITIPEGVTYIGEGAFVGCSSLVSVTLPHSLTSLGEEAFSSCNSLTSITIPDNVTYIGYGVFSYCSNLTNITIPDRVTTIGSSAFQYCTSLSSIIIPASLDRICGYVFSNCSSLTNIIIPGNVTSIEYQAFIDCSSLTTIKFEGNAPTVSDTAFAGVTATVYYPTDNPTWTADVRQTYGGTLTWIPDNPVGEETTEPTEPTEPTNPIEPIEPTDPSEPSNPTDPTEPTIPTYPDTWSFLNSPDYFGAQSGGYYITSADHNRLIQNLTETEREAILKTGYMSTFNVDGRLTPNNYLYKPYRFWNGSCYGMSSWVVLNCQHIRSASDIDSSVKYLAEFMLNPSENTNVESAVNFYQYQTRLSPIQKAAEDYLSRSQDEQLDIIEELGKYANQTGEPFLLWFQWYPDFPEDGSPTLAAHAVVGYGWEEIEPVQLTVNGQTFLYDHRIWIYDCSKTNSRMDMNLYYSNYNRAWCIPDWNIISISSQSADSMRNNGQLVWASNDASLINLVDYNTGIFNSTESVVTSITAAANAHYALSFDEIQADISGFNVNSDTQDHGITVMIHPNITPDGTATDTIATAILPIADGYTVTSEDDTMAYSMQNENYLTYAALDAPGSITFESNGNASIQAETAADYTINLVTNDEYHVLNWHEVEIRGTASVVSAEASEECIIVTGDDLTKLTIYAEGDEQTQTITISSDEDSVLITDSPGGALTVCEDIDEDGVYETEIVAYTPFTDVPSDSFYYEPVLWAVEEGITTGATETTFNPTGDCLRAQVVTFLWRAAGEPKPTSTHNPFVDVKPSDFYYDAVLWAVENGITNGADATHFNPMGVCNRAQVVTFLYRAFESPAVENVTNPFSDVPNGAFYEAPVLWAVENGITNGLSATQFGPNAACNRAQVVTFLYRAYND